RTRVKGGLNSLGSIVHSMQVPPMRRACAPEKRWCSVRVRLIASAFAASLAFHAAATGGEDLPERVEFNRDIRPILSDTCYHCHGPDKAKRKAGFRLDLEASAKAKIEDHFAIVPGDPAKSELIRLITATDEDDRMPPADSGRQLSPRQIELLRRWIE